MSWPCLNVVIQALCLQPQFAAQLVFYKLGEVARYRQLAWFRGAAGHAHWQGARGYWFERLAHQVFGKWR